MFKRIYSSQTGNITFAAIIIASSGIFSKFLGLIRDRLLAGRFGAGEDLDVYFAAFRIPDFIYGLLIAGGVAAAFLPVFSEYFAKEKGWSPKVLEFANSALNCFLLLLLFLCGILAIFTPFLIKLIFPGFSSEMQSLTVSLTRIMLLSPIFFGISSIFSGILHYFNRFLPYSLAPIFYNLGIIFGIIFLVPSFGIFGLAYGVVAGAIMHFLIQAPAAGLSGYRYKPLFNFNFPGIKKIFKLMIPRTIGVAVNNINLIIVTAIASTFAVGSITIFNFSNNLHYFPIGIIGFSFAISSFPAFSRLWANGQKEEFFNNFSSSLRKIFLFITPISFLMFLLRAQIVRLVLGTGEFGWAETRLTAASLGLFCLGIFAGGAIPLFTKAFFALQDTKTPLVIGSITVFLNLLLCFLFIFLLSFSNYFYDFLSYSLKLYDIEDIKIIGLPLALSLSTFVQALLLFIFLCKKLGDFGFSEIYESFKKILGASILMFSFSFFALQAISVFVNMETFLGVMTQTSFSLFIALIFYVLFLFLFGSEEIKNIKRAILGYLK